jgi:hypothetical protein
VNKQVHHCGASCCACCGNTNCTSTTTAAACPAAHHDHTIDGSEPRADRETRDPGGPYRASSCPSYFTVRRYILALLPASTSTGNSCLRAGQSSAPWHTGSSCCSSSQRTAQQQPGQRRQCCCQCCCQHCSQLNPVEARGRQAAASRVVRSCSTLSMCLCSFSTA